MIFVLQISGVTRRRGRFTSDLRVIYFDDDQLLIMVVIVANFNLNHRRNFKRILNFIFEIKIKSKLTLQIDIRNQTDLYFYLEAVFHLLPSWLVILLIKFDLIKLNTFVSKRKLIKWQ